MKLSVIIPSVQDPYLEKTIEDIRGKFKGEYEIIVTNGNGIGLRAAVNQGFAQAQGEYILKTDEHCKFDEGFDVKMLETIEDNWIVVPRRYKLNLDTWECYDEEPVDYDKLIIDRPEKIGGMPWRRPSKKNILLDETMVFQGSCYLMSRKHWDWLGGLQEDGYGPFAQEAVELALKTWLGGGKVMVNKNTWYAHKHRKFGRVLAPTRKEIEVGNTYSKDFWLNNRWEKRIHDLGWLIQRFQCSP